MGIGRGDFIPVAGACCPLTITALIGVIRSGAAVVPIDTDRPATSLSQLVEDTGAKLILIDKVSPWSRAIESIRCGTKVVTISTVLAQTRESNLRDVDVSAKDLAYVIYTSGSTGKPKGVMIPHGAIGNMVRWRSDNVTLSSDDRVIMMLSHQFDAGFGIAMSSLAQGASLVFSGSSSVLDIHATIDRIKDCGATVLPSVPSLLHPLVTHPRFQQCKSVQQIWSGGESMPKELPIAVRSKSNARIWNFYGPTETAVEATAFEVTDVDSMRTIPIGKPIANTDVLVLDEHGREVPDTVPGQLAIVGHGLAQGYLNQDERTSECFVPSIGDQALSSRMYLTGDLGLRRADGNLEFLGRHRRAN